MDKPIYIHYGHANYIPPGPIKNIDWFPKPEGGLWASRKGDRLGWKNWCECEGFRLESFNRWFEFVLKDNARVLELNDPAQLNDLPKQRTYDMRHRIPVCFLDFMDIARHYDAIEVTDISRLHFNLYGWDCNCILILNPEVIELI